MQLLSLSDKADVDPHTAEALAAVEQRAMLGPLMGRQRPMTMAQARAEEEAAWREWFGVPAGIGLAGIPVPPISLLGDRIFQRAVSSLLFARPSEVVPSDVAFGELLGAGCFGRVCSALWQGRRVAVRVISCSRRRTRPLLALATLTETLQQLRHEALVAVLGARTTLPRAFVLLEHAEHGCLADVLHQPSVRSLPRPMALSLLHDAACGLRHLHSHGVRHFNLRAANLMLWAAPFRVKVASIIPNADPNPIAYFGSSPDPNLTPPQHCPHAHPSPQSQPPAHAPPHP